MNNCFFVSDLHGKIDRYRTLFNTIRKEKPEMVFLGGDLLPSGLHSLLSAENIQGDFIEEILIDGFLKLKKDMGDNYPAVFLILGNDDSKVDEQAIIESEKLGIWFYMHERRKEYQNFIIYGYSYVPPSPFRLKDFEKYDVSRYVDPGCIPPEQGSFTTEVNRELIKLSTIKKDLNQLIVEDDLSNVILLFHSPPYQSNLDRAALDDKYIDHVPLDVHVGSIAIQRFIQKRQPLLSLHGHIHESARITGSWKDQWGKTNMFTAAHDGEELSLVKFNPKNLDAAIRVLLAH